MPDVLNALRTSVDRLDAMARPLDDTAITQPSYASEWSIADVLSHLGSGAVIMGQQLRATLEGAVTPDDFNQGVWDEWNAKSPRAKVDDALAVDGALMTTCENTSGADRDRFAASVGPFEFDWSKYLALRLNEHLVHEWDVAVALDPAVPLAGDGTDLVVDNLQLMAGFGSTATGPPGTIVIATVDPERRFAITISPEHVEFETAASGAEVDLTMPAEALIRLVYGRLDPQHTPTSVVGSSEALDQLRQVFRGI